MTKPDEPIRWDIALALTDVSLCIVEHIRTGNPPSKETLSEWLTWTNSAKQAYLTLEAACEDLVEEGHCAERVEAMKMALTWAQGQDYYWWRKDRW